MRKYVNTVSMIAFVLVLLNVLVYFTILHFSLSYVWLLLVNVCGIIIISVIHSVRRHRSINELLRVVDLIEHLIDDLDFPVSFTFSGSLYGKLEIQLLKLVRSLRRTNELLSDDKDLLKDNISDISHQLKTPLTSLQINNEILQNSRISQVKRDELLLNQIDLIESMSFLIKNLLKISRLESNSVEYNVDTYNILDIISTAVQTVDSIRVRKNIVIDVLGDNSSINTDAHWLQEAVVNILKNALEHSKENDTILVSVEENPIYILITIEDNGVGIPKGEEELIFERYFKKQSFSSDSVGIGLSISKRIIKHLKGDIKVESTNKGAKFIIKLYKV